MRRRQPLVAKKPIELKEKSFLERLARQWQLRKRARKTPEQWVAEYTAALQAAFKGETASILAATFAAKKTFDTTRQVDLPFPEKYFEGAAPIDDAAKAQLTAYAVALIKFLQVLEDDDRPLSTFIARGVPTWIASCYILARPDWHPQGRDIWARLLAQSEGLEEAHKLALRRDPSDVERQYFAYRPEVFTR